jgi:protein tyrosine phosphatase
LEIQSNSSISSETKKDTDWVTLAVCLGIILPLVIIPAIIVAIIIFMKRQRNKNNYGQEYDEEIGSSLKKDRGLKFTTVRKKHKPLEVISKPVLLEEFEEHVKKLGKDSGLGYAEEFESLSDVGKDQSVDVSQQQCNVSKNRYCNIRPYDVTRVKLLPSEEEDGSDYINASWIPGYYSKRQFIATQGPMQSTEDDFWRMVWEYNCRGIVMVTSLIEKGRDKCHHYWPRDKEPVSYGDIEVTITKENKTDKWDIREFQVSLGQHKRFLTHCHYTIWPDMEVPDEFDSLVEFIYLAREEVSFRGAGPVIVHCSAGVGRTGTFIAIDTLLHQLEEERMVDAFGCVYRMRMNRTFMVQNEKQYVFIHNSILAVIKKMNSTAGLDNDAYEESDVNKNRGSVTSSVNPDVNGVNSRNFNTNNRIDEVHGGHDMNGKLDIVHSHRSVYGGDPVDT